MSFLLLGCMSSILFGGLNGMMEFRKSMQPDMAINLENIRFFTKDYLHRFYQNLTATKLPSEWRFPSFYIYADEKEFESLGSDLPASGKTQYRQGHLNVDKPEYSGEAQFRYRGGLALHWLYKKKSLRIKLPPYASYRNERQFNLVNPSTIYTLTDWVSYDMARSVGLLTPDYFPARVFINNATNGLHFFLSQIDESFLRKNRRMPGSIYSGDTIYIPNPFGKDEDGMNEKTFTDRGSGVSLMWNDHRLWEKDASRNASLTADRRDIKKFLEVANQVDPQEFMKNYEVYFDKEKFYLFWGLDTLVGGFHHDLYHNHKVYFDPYRGKFEPIEWDIRFWTVSMRTPENPLLKNVRLNPILEFERDLTTFNLWKRFSVDDIVSRIDNSSKELEHELKADPYRQHPDSNNRQFNLDKEVPFSISEYLHAIENLKLTYKKRHNIVKKTLDHSSIEYTVESLGYEQVGITFSVTGNSPVDVNLWSVIPQSLRSRVKIARRHESEILQVEKSETLERLFPGRKIVQGNIIGKADLWSTLTFGKERIEPSPLHYQFIINGVDLIDMGRIRELTAINAITGKTISPVPVQDLNNDEETKSVHPWELLIFNKVPKSVTLSGAVTVNQDLVFSKEQQVTISPGTTFKLSKGRSLIFFGKVIAVGTPANPIRFVPETKGDSWGSIIIQGEAASGSHLSHVQVTGGSVATYQLIDYPGQLNIHDVKSFKLDHCLIKNNSIGDDALHISYSVGEVDNCLFENTAFDALDMDIVQVAVSNSQFTNIGNDALDLMTSKVSIRNSTIVGAGDKCFSVGEESDVTIYDSRLFNCVTGIAVKDKSVAYVENLEFGGIGEKAIALYRKNTRYSEGGRISGRQLHGISQNDMYVGEGSQSNLTSESFSPTE